MTNQKSELIQRKGETGFRGRRKALPFWLAIIPKNTQNRSFVNDLIHTPSYVTETETPFSLIKHLFSNFVISSWVPIIVVNIVY